MYDVWRMMYDVWCMAYDVWCNIDFDLGCTSNGLCISCYDDDI